MGEFGNMEMYRYTDVRNVEMGEMWKCENLEMWKYTDILMYEMWKCYIILTQTIVMSHVVA